MKFLAGAGGVGNSGVFLLCCWYVDAVDVFGAGPVGCFEVVWVFGHVEALGFGRCVEVFG